MKKNNKKFIKRKVISCLLILITIAALTACEDPVEKELSETTGNIGVFMIEGNSDFRNQAILHAEEEAGSIRIENGIGVEVFVSDSVSEQIKQINEAITKKVDCIVVFPQDGKQLRNTLIQAKNQGVKVIIYQNTVPDARFDGNFYYNNYELGKDMAEYFNTYFSNMLKSENINILEFRGNKNTTTLDRTLGFYEDIDSNIITYDVFNCTERVKAMNEFEKWLVENDRNTVESLDAIVTHYDEVGLGVLDAIKNYTGSYNLNIKLIATIGASQNITSVFSTSKFDLGIDFLSYEYSPATIRAAMQYGVELIKNKEISEMEGKDVILEPYMVDNNTLKEYIKSNSFILRYSLDTN